MPLPPEPSCPPPPSKPPCPEPKPPKLSNSIKAKARATTTRRVNRRRRNQEIYVQESDSDEEVSEMVNPGSLPAPTEKPKPPYVNLSIGGASGNEPPSVGGLPTESKEEEHLYDTAELPDNVKEKARKKLFVIKKEPIKATTTTNTTPLPVVNSAPAPPTQQYQNVKLGGEPDEIPYDENPMLPPRVAPPSYEDAPILPPRSTSLEEHHVPSSAADRAFPSLPQAKKLPQVPPTSTKPKPLGGLTTQPPRFPPPLGPAPVPKVIPPTPPAKTLPKKAAPPTPSKPDKSHSGSMGSEQLSEQLSTLFANRNGRGSGTNLFSPSITAGGRKQHSWKRGEPHLPPTGGYF